MRDVWIKRLGKHRGAPRIFLDGLQAVRAGFAPGERFDVDVDGSKVTIVKCEDGSRVVSARRRRDAEQPVIDINSAELLSLFEGMDSVRVVVAHERVYLLPLASELKMRERLARLTTKLDAGEPLKLGSVSHGGGVLSHAIHKGLSEAGIECKLAFANEIREDLLLQALEHNDAWSPRQGGATGTAALALPMQEMAQDEWLLSQLPKIEVLELGLPCSGASRAGRAKRGLTMMEDHPEVGHLVHAALVILDRVQPAIVVLENVPLYAESASAQILRHQLRDMGFTCHEAILEGKDFGALENRVRWCLVAVTKGLHFDFSDITPVVRVVRRLGEVLDPEIGPDDPRWRAMAYLDEKRERDVAKGNNFKQQLVTPDDAAVPTLRKGYHKGGSTDPLLVHPDRPDLKRLLTAAEHARVKGVPEHLVDGLSETIAHQVLGQGIVYQPFVAVGLRIGEALVNAVGGEQDGQEERAEVGASYRQACG